MSAGELRTISSVPTGNSFNKYGSSSPVVRRLMTGFDRALEELIDRAAPDSILDVGCGEGVLAMRWAQRRGAHVVGVDLPDPELERHWGACRHPNLRFVSGRAEELPFADGEFELVAAIETLEHIADVEGALAEMVRVARGHVLVSVPREPLWRVLNVGRGAYVDRLGNTPGHVRHFSKRGLVQMLARHGELVETRAPLPWSMALFKVG